MAKSKGFGARLTIGVVKGACRAAGGVAKGTYKVGKSAVQWRMVGGNVHNASASRAAGKRRSAAAKAAERSGSTSTWNINQMKGAAKARRFWK